MRYRTEPDAAPCEVIVAEFVFGVNRCGEDALYTTEWDGEWWRICGHHAEQEGQQ